MNGQVKLIWENNSGEMVETELEPSKGYNTLVGQKYRLVSHGLRYFRMFYARAGVTWRLEDDYSRPDETPEQSGQRSAVKS